VSISTGKGRSVEKQVIKMPKEKIISYVVQSVGRESIFSTKQSVKIMSPKVVPNKTEDRNPNICFYPIFLRPWPCSVGVAFVKNREDSTGQSSYKTKRHVTPLA